MIEMSLWTGRARDPMARLDSKVSGGGRGVEMCLWTVPVACGVVGLKAAGGSSAHVAGIWDTKGLEKAASYGMTCGIWDIL